MATPKHLLPESCYICGGEPHAPGGHVFESNAEADARIAREPRYQSSYDPAAAYVAEYRPY